MTATKELQATARAKVGKGAARAERRAGRVPCVIYGEGKAPLGITVDHIEINKLIYNGHFLTTLFNIEVEGKKHRVIPRDYQLHPVKDYPVHIDFLRVSKGAEVEVEVPVHFLNADTAPAIKQGGTLNIVSHAVSLRVAAESIPEAIEVDVAKYNFGDSIHLSAITLPNNAVWTGHGDDTLATITAPSGLKEAQEEEEAAAAAAASTDEDKE